MRDLIYNACTYLVNKQKIYCISCFLVGRTMKALERMRIKQAGIINTCIADNFKGICLQEIEKLTSFKQKEKHGFFLPFSPADFHIID